MISSYFKMSFLSLLLSSLLTGLYSQDPKIIFEEYTVADGLPEEFVRDVYQDDLGFMWFGTQNGLVKYDGYDFMVYGQHADTQEGKSLPIRQTDRFITGLDGNFWMVTNDTNESFLVNYKLRQNRFEYYKLPVQDSLSGDNLFYLSLFQEDPTHYWLTRFKIEHQTVEMCRYDTETQSFTCYPYFARHNRGNPVGCILSLCRAEDRSIWVVDSSAVLRKWNEVENIFEPVLGHSGAKKAFPDSILSINETQSGQLIIYGRKALYLLDAYTLETQSSFPHDTRRLPPGYIPYAFEDTRGNIWVTFDGEGAMSKIDLAINEVTKYTYGQGPLAFEKGPKSALSLVIDAMDENGIYFREEQADHSFYYAFQTDHFQYYGINFGHPENRLNTFKNLLLDQSGLLWLGTRPNLYKEAPKKQLFKSYRHQVNDKNSLPSNVVTALLEDRQQRIWVGTDEGLALYQSTQDNFTVYQHDPKKARSITHNNISKIFEDSQGKIWVGTQNGLSIWNEKTNQFKRIFYAPNGRNGTASILEDQKDRIWVSILGKGVFVLDLNSRRVLQSFEASDPNYPFSYILFIHQDSKGNIWLAEPRNNEHGLFRYEEPKDRFIAYNEQGPDSLKIPDDEIHGLFNDPQGNLWAFTDNNGAFQYSFENQQFIAYDFMVGHSVSTYAIDNSGQIWLSTYSGGGLGLIDLEAQSFTMLGTDKGLLHNDLSANITNTNPITIDQFGQLWLPTPRGLSIFDPQSKSFRNFTLEDGFPENSDGSISILSSAGKVWLGDKTNGLMLIDPEELMKKDTTPPQVVITSMGISDSVYTQPDGKIFEQAISHTQKVRLKYWQRDLSFGFIGLHYLVPEKNQYRWKLENYDADWSSSSFERKASYTNLSPGSYTFRVKASNADGVWNEEGASLQIVILPPWWQTIWAYLTYALLLGIGIWQFIQNRTKKLKENNRLLEEKVEHRTRSLGERVEELQTINEISKAAVSGLKVEELVQTIGARMQESFKADYSHIALLDAQKEWIEFKYQYGEKLPNIRFGEGISSRIITKKEPLLINENVGRTYQELGLKVVGNLPGSYIGVPIPSSSSREMIGVLSVQRKDSNKPFLAEDKNILTTIASTIGVAINNAQLFEETQIAYAQASAAKEKAQIAEAQANEANEAKSTFLSTVSHELRTPLTSILGFTKIIQKRFNAKVLPVLPKGDEKLDKTVNQISKNLEVVISEGDRLTTLINDVLDLAKIEAGRTEWHLEQVNINALIQQAQAATSSLFDAKKLDYRENLQANLPSLTADKDKVIQVLINLLSNSVKFTDHGEITTLSRVENDEVIVSVQDTGIGIDEKDIHKVFDKFRQVGDTLTDKPKGTGLGLPICKEIIEQLGGRIWAESTPGRGSTFSFSLPINQRVIQPANKPYLNELVQALKDKMPLTKTVLADKRQQNILVVDDEASIRELLRQELSEFGYQVTLAEDGKQALKMIRERKPDMLILDVMMPELNGFDLAAILKNDPKTMDIPILILSIVQDKERGYRIGVDRYLNKPIDTELLLNEVEVLLSKGSSSKKVLIVDESTSTIRTLTEVLSARGYQVVEAGSQDMLEKAKAALPDVIILNSEIGDRDNIIKTIRFEKGLENVLFLLYQ